jgi:hypothetical protein
VGEGDDSPDPAIEEAWEQEIVKRIASIENGAALYSDAEQVLAEFDSRFPG